MRGRVSIPLAHNDEEAMEWANQRMEQLRIRGVFRDDRVRLYRNPKY